MKIITLIENTEGSCGCASKHGLSFYIETNNHTLLMDTGPNSLLKENAETLGIDLKKVDTVILSHGHYDHGGGLPTFFSINKDAKWYLPKLSVGEYYSIHNGEKHYIGLPKLEPTMPIIWTEETYSIDKELELFSNISLHYPLFSTNLDLKEKTDSGFIQDTFSHEQCLVIHENGKDILFSGCAHHGMDNILERYHHLYHKDPHIVISGLHTMKPDGYTDLDKLEIQELAKRLQSTSIQFYTCHCTGIEPYQWMKEIMNDQIEYLHCGDTLNL